MLNMQHTPACNLIIEKKRQEEEKTGQKSHSKEQTVMPAT